MTLLLFSTFVILVVLRIPLAISIGIAVVVGLVHAGFSSELYSLPLHVLEGISNPSLLAVPFFIMAGNLMNAVGMTDKIFDFTTALVGHFRAGLAQVNVLSSMIFAGVSGAAVADCAGLGMVEIRAMTKRGYPPSFAAALTVASSVIGPIIPPSIPLVIYGFLSNTSIGRLFLAGVVPGILIGTFLLLFNFLVAKRRNFPREPRAPLRHICRTAVDGFAALIAPGIILAAIVTGFTTPTEAGVLACAYSLALGMLYHKLTLKGLWTALSDTMFITTVIMIVVGFSRVIAWLMAIEQVPQFLAESILLVTENPAVFCGLLIVLLLLVGCLVEGVAAMLILAPMLLPIIDSFGIDRVHFGIIITYALLVGIATPPMGIGIYIVVKISETSFERVTLELIPLLLPLVLSLIAITFFPSLTLWLPNLLMGPAG